MSEVGLSLDIEEAYVQLKDSLLRIGCKIIAEEPPRNLFVQQGTLSGVSPFGAKKLVKFNLLSANSITRISSSTEITKSWTNIAVIGNIVAAVLVTLFWWMAVDVQNFVTAQKTGYWVWMAKAFGYPNLGLTSAMITLTKGLAIFLAIVIAIETLIVVYVYQRKNRFAENHLKKLETTIGNSERDSFPSLETEI